MSLPLIVRRRAAVVLLVGLLAANPSAAAEKSSCEWDGIGRIVAIGDVHGAYDRFVEILKVAGLIEPRLRVVVGDVDDERVAVPAAARIAHPHIDPRARGRPGCRRDDAVGMRALEEDQHVVGRLENLDLCRHVHRPGHA